MLPKLFSMGGYALYVWPAYVMVIFVLVINAWQSIRQLRAVNKDKDAEAQTSNRYSY